MDDQQWWFNLETGEPELGPGAPNRERLGPFATREEAAQALETAHRRSEEWDAQDEEE